jgi:gluconate 5-dehydrogenase
VAKLMAANLDGPFLVTPRAPAGDESAAPRQDHQHLLARRRTWPPNIVPYATSKGALRMLTRALAVEVASSNIQVNGISPGSSRRR